MVIGCDVVSAGSAAAIVDEVLAGYAVLRFTNDDIHRDAATVLATVARLLTDRRQKGNAT